MQNTYRLRFVIAYLAHIRHCHAYCSRHQCQQTSTAGYCKPPMLLHTYQKAQAVFAFCYTWQLLQHLLCPLQQKRQTAAAIV